MVWVTDFTFLDTKLINEPKSKIKLLLIYDLGNGEIVGAKVFKFNKIKTRNAKKNEKSPGISSLYVSKFFRTILLKYHIINLQKPLLLHSDRGVEFVSKEYCQLEKDFPVQISMTAGYQPTENPVAERLNKTFKKQLKYIQPSIPKQIETIQKLQNIINKKVVAFNKTFKTKRNENIGAELLRELMLKSNENIPVPAMTYSQGVLTNKPDQMLDVEHFNIQTYRKNIAKTYQFKDNQANFCAQQILVLLEKLYDKQEKLNIQQHLAALYQLQSTKNTQEKLDQILAYLKPKVKKQTIQHKPQRIPLTKQIYYHLMDEPKVKNQQNVGFYRFRLTTTLLYFTGMRLQEVGDLTESQLQQLIKTQKTQIFMTKTKKHRFVAIPKQAIEILDTLKFESQVVFDFSELKTQTRTIRHTTQTKNNFNNFLTWYNRQLKLYLIRVSIRLNDPILFQNIKLLSSHSFRINKITQWLWKHIPLTEVAKMIGHQNVQTTNLYYRWNEYNPQMLEKITQIEQDD